MYFASIYALVHGEEKILNVILFHYVFVTYIHIGRQLCEVYSEENHGSGYAN